MSDEPKNNEEMLKAWVDDIEKNLPRGIEFFCLAKLVGSDDGVGISFGNYCRACSIEDIVTWFFLMKPKHDDDGRPSKLELLEDIIVGKVNETVN